MKLLTQRRRTLWLAVGGILLLTLTILGCVYRTRLRTVLHVLVDETGSKKSAVLCVAAALFLLFSLLLWMVFPLLVYAGLKDLRRRTTQLDESTRLCASHLARLTEQGGGPQQKTPAPDHPQSTR